MLAQTSIRELVTNELLCHGLKPVNSWSEKYSSILSRLNQNYCLLRHLPNVALTTFNDHATNLMDLFRQENTLLYCH
jgi:hypothetical protein